MKRSKFNLSHRLLATGDFGYLYPILVEDVLPGDKFKLSSEVYMKAIPLLAPIMESVDVRVDYFFVPNRLLWSKWQEFITGGADGTSDLVSPWFNPKMQVRQSNNTKYFNALTSHLYQIGLLEDDEYNIDPSGLEQLQLDALPLCAYNKIYYDWYVDENLETIPKPEDSDCPYFIKDGDYVANGRLTDDWLKTNQILNYNLNPFCLRQRKYKKDYFTSSLPWPQRGPEVAIDIPPHDMTIRDLEGQVEIDEAGPIPTSTKNLQVNNEGNFRYQSETDEVYLFGDSYLDIRFNKGTLGSVSIPELRRLSAIQRWFERNARWGSRYIEQILSHFGVRTPDYRLDRSEYLGGTISPINVSETYQTALGVPQQETADVLGQYAGHLTSYSVNGCRKLYAQEHGWLIGLLSVVPRASYGQGLQKRFTRSRRLDYAWPEFASIGEQAVKREEVLVSPASIVNNQTFGYQRRYAEYMSRQDRFDQNMLNEFPFWHLGRIFNPSGAMNILSQAFLECTNGYTQSPTNQDRIFAYSPSDLYNFDRFHFIYQINHRVLCKRPIPKYVSPVLK